jgi:hypothetical protein
MYHLFKSEKNTRYRRDFFGFPLNEKKILLKRTVARGLGHKDTLPKQQ